MRRIVVCGLISGSILIGLGCREDAPHEGASVDVTAPPDPAVLSTVGQVLETGRHPWLRWPALSDVAGALRGLYAGEVDGLFWFVGEAPHAALAEALQALSSADERGLVPDDYDAKRLAADWNQLSTPASIEASERALFDLAVTVGVLRELQAVHSGRVDPVTLDWGFDVRPKKLETAALLQEARDGEGVVALLDKLEPSYPHYVRNRRELAHYRRLARDGEPERVPSLPKGRRKIAPGDAWEGVSQLRARLQLFGDLPADSTPAPSGGAPVYEAPLVDAVKRFQARHILDADGVIGAATIDAINVPLARRARQLELAMERGRWLPRLSDRPTVFVNVPVFRLWASDPVRGDEPLRMNVVVGKSMSSHTPIFVQYMEYVVFRPYWNPPFSITTKEIVPAARRDPSYLERENMEIVGSGADDAPALPMTIESLDAVAAGRLFVRQKPGPKNSLGLAKFIFPNRENVYMHGTPAQHLFSRTRRDFSHGCIRLESPVGLAEWVLRDVPGWTRARIEAAMQGERPTRVNLKEPLMVVIFYDTVHVNSEGVVHFVGDIYGHDQALDEALARGYPYPEAD
jgi:murein L,D-transpeptidase YcbB/YkuD